MSRLENSLVGVCGAGAMGSGIAQIAAQAGHDVIVYDQNAEALKAAAARLDKGLEKLTARGKISAQEAGQITDRMTWTDAIDALGQCHLIVEAIIEDLAIKADLFQKLESLVAEDAILATNTSSLSVSALGAKLQHSERFVGLHFFNPAPIMKLVEIVPARTTVAAITTELEALMVRWKKVAVVAKDVPGFIVNRVARPFYSEGWRAYEEEAASAATLDFLYRDLGRFRMGPLELGDLIGHDINTAAAASIFNAYFGKTRFRPSLLQRQLVELGCLGRKTGEGVYKYEDGAVSEPVFEPVADLQSPILISASGADMFKASGMTVSAAETDEAIVGLARLGDVDIYAPDGRSARELSRSTGRGSVVLDRGTTFSGASALAFCASDDKSAAVGSAFAQAAGLKAVQLEDRPGGLVWRTFAQLANCAGDALLDKVCDEAAVDQALLFGVNYPVGPLSWAREIGLDLVITSLENIAAETGDPMYAPSEGLRRLRGTEL